MKPGIDYIGVSVGVCLVNDKGEIFLAKRSQHASNERGCWEKPGGKVDFGESLQDAIKREMKEEYGIEIELIHQLPAQNHFIPKENQHWVPTCFIARLLGDKQPKIMEPHKCDAIGWFALDNLPSPLSIITKLDLKAYTAYLKNKTK